MSKHYPVMATIHEVTALRTEVARLTSENALLKEPFDGVYLHGEALEAVKARVSRACWEHDHCGDGHEKECHVALKALSLDAPEPDSLGCECEAPMPDPCVRYMCTDKGPYPCDDCEHYESCHAPAEPTCTECGGSGKKTKFLYGKNTATIPCPTCHESSMEKGR